MGGDNVSTKLLIGGAGQLGHDLRRLAPDAFVSLDLPELDITSADQVAAAMQTHRPGVVINCAAQTNVDGCETAPADAFAINALGAWHVARSAAEVGARVIYISTDYVYGAAGKMLLSYAESDPPGPVNVYGASKLAGEHLTLAYNPRSLVVRTCGLYGHAGARGKGGNFVETMLRLAGEGRSVRVVNDQILAPTSTVECAHKLLELAEHDVAGVVHIAATDSCSWYEFAREIFARLPHDVDLAPIPSSEYPTPARRPEYSALRSERLAPLGIAPCRTWRTMLHEYLETRPTTAS